MHQKVGKTRIVDSGRSGYVIPFLTADPPKKEATWAPAASLPHRWDTTLGVLGYLNLKANWGSFDTKSGL